MTMTAADAIAQANTCLGIEFGSTRIKACLIDSSSFTPIANGAYTWENRLENGIWTYSQADILCGLQGCYADLKRNVQAQYGITLTSVGAMGISAMMHGYLAFDKSDELLVPFRTWRNTITGAAAEKLSALFSFNIPQRWSIAHLYQAILNREPHVQKIAHLNTLAGWVHFLLTGERVLGIGDASGMFPITDCGFDPDMMRRFSALPEVSRYSWQIGRILPLIAPAGEQCGKLTAAGAKLLDPEGDLLPGIPFCPPEGDAGTGMTATNSVRQNTGNVSAGTSVFSMLVLEKPMRGYYPEIDIVTTPDGADVAMVHCNNCCGELDVWVRMFAEFSALTGHPVDVSEAYAALYRHAMTAAPDCGGVTAYNFLSGEPVVGAAEGRPAYFRTPDGTMDLAHFMRAELYAAVAALKSGNDILTEKEGAVPAKVTGHGGFFKIAGTAQQVLADALGCPVSVMETAGEGGAWGMSLLAAYAMQKDGRTLADWLDSAVFSGMAQTTLYPDPDGAAGWESYMTRWQSGIVRSPQ